MVLRSLCLLDDEIQRLSVLGRKFIVHVYIERKAKNLPQPDWKGRGWRNLLKDHHTLYDAIYHWFTSSCDDLHISNELSDKLVIA